MVLSLVHPKVKELIDASGAVFEELSQSDDEKAYYSVKEDLIAINLSCERVCEQIGEVVLHELTHWTGSGKRLARKIIVEWEKMAQWHLYDYMALTIAHRHTEELTAELGMHKMGTFLGLDPIYLDTALSRYRVKIPWADVDQAERESDEAVAYLINFMKKSQAA